MDSPSSRKMRLLDRQQLYSCFTATGDVIRLEENVKLFDTAAHLLFVNRRDNDKSEYGIASQCHCCHRHLHYPMKKNKKSKDFGDGSIKGRQQTEVIQKYLALQPQQRKRSVCANNQFRYKVSENGNNNSQQPHRRCYNACRRNTIVSPRYAIVSLLFSVLMIFLPSSSSAGQLTQQNNQQQQPHEQRSRRRRIQQQSNFTGTAETSQVNNDSSNSSILTVSNGGSLDVCFDAQYAADSNQDGKLHRSEYMVLLRDMSPYSPTCPQTSNINDFVGNTSILAQVFDELACLCQDYLRNETKAAACCATEQFIALPNNPYDFGYSYRVCQRIESALEEYCGDPTNTNTTTPDDSNYSTNAPLSPTSTPTTGNYQGFGDDEYERQKLENYSEPPRWVRTAQPVKDSPVNLLPDDDTSSVLFGDDDDADEPQSSGPVVWDGSSQQQSPPVVVDPNQQKQFRVAAVGLYVGLPFCVLAIFGLAILVFVYYFKVMREPLKDPETSIFVENGSSGIPPSSSLQETVNSSPRSSDANDSTGKQQEPKYQTYNTENRLQILSITPLPNTLSGRFKFQQPTTPSTEASSSPVSLQSSPAIAAEESPLSSSPVRLSTLLNSFELEDLKDEDLIRLRKRSGVDIYDDNSTLDSSFTGGQRELLNLSSIPESCGRYNVSGSSNSSRPRGNSFDGSIISANTASSLGSGIANLGTVCKSFDSSFENKKAKTKPSPSSSSTSSSKRSQKKKKTSSLLDSAKKAESGRKVSDFDVDVDGGDGRSTSESSNSSSSSDDENDSSSFSSSSHASSGWTSVRSSSLASTHSILRLESWDSNDLTNNGLTKFIIDATNSTEPNSSSKVAPSSSQRIRSAPSPDSSPPRELPSTTTTTPTGPDVKKSRSWPVSSSETRKSSPSRPTNTAQQPYVVTESVSDETDWHSVQRMGGLFIV